MALDSAFDYVLDLRLPERKSAFVGIDCGRDERARLNLPLVDKTLYRQARPGRVCLCTRKLGNGIVTQPYLEGLLGTSILFWGVDTFLSIYRVQRSPSQGLETLPLTDFCRMIMQIRDGANQQTA